MFTKIFCFQVLLLLTVDQRVQQLSCRTNLLEHCKVIELELLKWIGNENFHFLISERTGKTGKSSIDRFLISSPVLEISAFKEV